MIDPPAPDEGGNDEPEAASLDEAAEAIAERAIGSVLEQLPAGDDPNSLETSVRYQPWADTAAPAGKNKRPLEELLAELSARVEASQPRRAPSCRRLLRSLRRSPPGPGRAWPPAGRATP